MSGDKFNISDYNENYLNKPLGSLHEKEIKNFWNESMKYIVFGFMFTLLTFNFLWLQLILPSVGAVLLYTGFSKLRRVNKAFNSAWIFSIINLIFNVLNLIYVSTPLNVNYKNTGIIVFLGTIFQVSFLIVFRKGIRGIFNKENILVKKDPILGLIIWRVLIILLAITELGEIWIISIPIIIYYFYSIKSIYKLSYTLETINNISLKEITSINKKFITLFYEISCIFIVGICCLFSNHIKLNPIEITPVNEFGTRNMLIDSGVPLDIVKNIVDEDISMLKNIVNINISSQNLIFDNNSKNTLEATSIFIELNNNEMYGIEYFNWGDKGPYWQNGIEINNFYSLDLINGRLLYKIEDTEYFSKIPRLSGGAVISGDIFGVQNKVNQITGAINYPHESKSQRGYVFYKINIPEGGIAGNNIVNYKLSNHPFRIPYTDIEKKNLSFSNKLRQHVTTFETKDIN
ncbi:hypothetical protein [Clostridium sp.]|uniref:hypothetical protein n=1 Tax=Clostridium sp. TaxID=1506 RepID=UPI00290F4BAC|nr:hypothetical protein [Clostridium sp.]MDU5105910.1 hypothetical protein [Clostridium sp.]